MNWKLLISIIIILILTGLELILNPTINDFLINIIPEVIGIIITYRIIEGLIKKSKEQRIGPFISVLYEKIGYAVYDISSGLGHIRTPEHDGKNYIDVVKEGKSLLNNTLNQGIDYFPGELIKIISDIDIRLEHYIDFYDVFTVPEYYLDIALKILKDFERILEIIDKKYQLHMVNEALKSIEYDIDNLN